jgi:hypothetical protein
MIKRIGNERIKLIVRDVMNGQKDLMFVENVEINK